LLCVYVEALRRADPASKESCRLFIELRKGKRSVRANNNNCTEHLMKQGIDCDLETNYTQNLRGEGGIMVSYSSRTVPSPDVSESNTITHA
jgi:hypothetical protein